MIIKLKSVRETENFLDWWAKIPDDATCNDCGNRKDDHWYDDKYDRVRCMYEDGYCETCYFSCSCELFEFDTEELEDGTIK